MRHRLYSHLLKWRSRKIDTFIHPTAIIENNVHVGSHVKVWHFCHVRRRSILEDNVSLGRDVYIDEGVCVGRGSRIQNGVSVYHGVEIAPWSFIGPHVIFTNDKVPRAGSKKWNIVKTQISLGSSIGAGAIILCGIELGAFSLVGAGSIVTQSVDPFCVAMGAPGCVRKMTCACGGGGATFFPLGTPKADLVRDCCEKSLHKDLYTLALEYVARESDRKRNRSVKAS